MTEQEPIMDIQSLSAAIGEANQEEAAENENSNDDEEIIVVDDEADGTDEPIQDEPPEEEKPKKKKFKRDKRIENLVKKNTQKNNEIEELKKQIEELSRKNQAREAKERNAELDILDQKKKEAFESSDYEEFKKYEEQMANVRNDSSQMTSEDMENYFKSNNTWYGVDEAKTLVAQGVHDKILRDPKYQYFSDRDKLDLVSKQVNEMPQFKKNPYQDSVHVEGATMERASNRVTVTKGEVEHVRQMFPHLNEKEVLIRTKELVQAINNN